jgi:hypothetical protein
MNVVLHRLLGEIQLGCDFFIGQFTANHLNKLLFSACEAEIMPNHKATEQGRRLATCSNNAKHSLGEHTASSFVTNLTAATTSIAEASFNTYPTIPSRTARTNVSGSASMPIMTTFKPGIAARTSAISRKPDSATAVESDRRTSGSRFSCSKCALELRAKGDSQPI